MYHTIQSTENIQQHELYNIRFQLKWLSTKWQQYDFTSVPEYGNCRERHSLMHRSFVKVVLRTIICPFKIRAASSSKQPTYMQLERTAKIIKHVANLYINLKHTYIHTQNGIHFKTYLHLVLSKVQKQQYRHRYQTILMPKSCLRLAKQCSLYKCRTNQFHSHRFTQSVLICKYSVCRDKTRVFR